ncbi:MAG TPA: Mur ligase family protein, partial [Lacibacter sp.]|nr:Mur ligase family protein [Lacibacter sp.]
KNGLAFSHCDVAIVTNVAADHIGLGGINSVEQMAKLKAVVPETVFPHGYAILNADDDRVYAMRNNLTCNIALFSMDENNPRIKEHCSGGGLATVFENGYVSILKGTWKIRVLPVKEIPITFEGKAVHNIANTLPAVMATYLYKDISIEDIRSALLTFVPSSNTTPGRMNFFHFRNYTMLADFAHNPHGLQLLCDFVNKLDYPYKVGVISGTGDRRDEDIRELGAISARNFDEIIMRCDKNRRGRTADEIMGLLEEGIRSVNDRLPVTKIANENEALEYIYANHRPGALYTIMCDVVAGALDKIKELKEREDQAVH